MKQQTYSSSLHIAAILTLVHCIAGNAIGMYVDGDNFMGYLFFPYSFIAGMSEFAGWDNMSLILEIFSAIIMWLIFFGIVRLFEWWRR